MDRVAARLGIDPLDLRLRNVIDVGGAMVTGQVLDESVGARATLEAVRPAYEAARSRAAAEPPALPWRRGIGLACIWQINGGGRGEEAGGGWHGLKLGPAKAAVELTDAGRVRVLCGVVEKGQGISIALAQIAAQVLGVPLARSTCVRRHAAGPVSRRDQRPADDVPRRGRRRAGVRGCSGPSSWRAAPRCSRWRRRTSPSDDGWVQSRSRPARRLPLAEMARHLRSQRWPCGSKAPSCSRSRSAGRARVRVLHPGRRGGCEPGDRAGPGASGHLLRGPRQAHQPADLGRPGRWRRDDGARLRAARAVRPGRDPHAQAVRPVGHPGSAEPRCVPGHRGPRRRAARSAPRGPPR